MVISRESRTFGKIGIQSFCANTAIGRVNRPSARTGPEDAWSDIKASTRAVARGQAEQPFGNDGDALRLTDLVLRKRHAAAAGCRADNSCHESRSWQSLILRSGAAVSKDAELVPFWVGKYDPARIALADVGVSST